MEKLHKNKQSGNESLSTEVKAGAAILIFFAVASWLIALAGVCVFGYQVYFWLMYGYWKPLQAALLLKGIVPTSFLEWLVDETAWVGLKKIILFVFDSPLSLFLIVFAIVFYWIIKGLIEDSSSAKQAREETEKITIDTNILSKQKLLDLCRRMGFDVSVVTVTEREIDGTSFQDVVKKLYRILEIGVWGESSWGKFVWADSEAKDDLEKILEVISNKSFPVLGKRDNLSKGQRKQLLDAMVLLAHTRSKRDIFVSNDEKAFIRNGRREQLEKMFNTKIMNEDDFISFLKSYKK